MGYTVLGPALYSHTDLPYDLIRGAIDFMGLCSAVIPAWLLIRVWRKSLSHFLAFCIVSAVLFAALNAAVVWLFWFSQDATYGIEKGTFWLPREVSADEVAQLKLGMKRDDFRFALKCYPLGHGRWPVAWEWVSATYGQDSARMDSLRLAADDGGWYWFAMDEGFRLAEIRHGPPGVAANYGSATVVNTDRLVPDTMPSTVP
jgi:hypothetical protein